ncbi:MAG: single-stranded DNA-binding protein [Cytophagaceae bacterium]|nr:single-stranded DNA-binding protein [Cytophagaceae bacterium]MBK9510075.1 single-stranded DNA-binding protein [Cytophagaceae bacterium]MBL0302785.1 single-stranded DNA-binding protein [Cytophagaceae bacterium]
MASLNKVMLIGNLGTNPEIRTLPSGVKVATFNIATSESFTNKNGEKVEQTEWHRIELWDNLAEIGEKFLQKGDSVYIEGKLRTEKYTDANGIEKFIVKIRGNSMQMLGRKSEKAEIKNANTEVPAAVNDDLPF